jgi:TatA/E family protein of Tat protein translocase
MEAGQTTPAGIRRGFYLGGVMIGIAFLGGTIGPMELMVVLTAVLLLFGSERLPDLARRIGRFMNQLREASDEVRRQVLNPPEERLPRPAPDRPAQPGSDSAKEEPHDRVG